MIMQDHGGISVRVNFGYEGVLTSVKVPLMAVSSNIDRKSVNEGLVLGLHCQHFMMMSYLYSKACMKIVPFSDKETTQNATETTVCGYLRQVLAISS